MPSAAEPLRGDTGKHDPDNLTGDQVDTRERDFQERKASMPKAAVTEAVTSEVYFHVITDGAEGAVTDEELATLLDLMNDAFAGGQGGGDTEISFTHAGTDRTDNAAWYRPEQGSQDGADMKNALHKGDAKTLNVYINELPGLAGYATCPSSYDSYPKLDGVVLNNGYMGDTMVHEAGHWLGLMHTFQGGCEGDGDQVEDTAPMSENAPHDCPEGQDTCEGGDLDPAHNYMSYSSWDCRSEFTPGQTTRMHEQWVAYRA